MKSGAPVADIDFGATDNQKSDELEEALEALKKQVEELAEEVKQNKSSAN